tara:strand:+ start:4263 stop:4559 length:297 start_codon:yes stop_codon:yes gene_type:complete
MNDIIEIQGKRCQNLWRAVIHQALIDIEVSTGYSKNKGRVSEEQLNQAIAKRWIMDKTVNFLRACEMADVEPDHIRRHAREIIKAQALNECGMAINEA